VWAERAPRLHRLLENKYYVDEAYDRLIVRPLHFLAKVFWKGVDALLIDGTINLGAALTELTGDVARFSTTGNVRNYALYFFLGVLALFWWVLL
jgi:NADH-quinone oxidoreductase subunit L